LVFKFWHISSGPTAIFSCIFRLKMAVSHAETCQNSKMLSLLKIILMIKLLHFVTLAKFCYFPLHINILPLQSLDNQQECTKKSLIFQDEYSPIGKNKFEINHLLVKILPQGNEKGSNFVFLSMSIGCSFCSAFSPFSALAFAPWNKQTNKLANKQTNNINN